MLPTPRAACSSLYPNTLSVRGSRLSLALRYAVTQGRSSWDAGVRPLTSGSTVSSTAGSSTVCSCCSWRCDVSCPSTAAAAAAARCLGCSLGGLGSIQFACTPAATSAASNLRWLLLLKPCCIICTKVRFCLRSNCSRPVAGLRLPSSSRHSLGRIPHPGTHPFSFLQCACTSR